MRSSRFTTMAATVGAVAMLVTAGASGATAAPETRLPDADLWCSGTMVSTDDWVVMPQAGTLWVEDGDLAGHYVILESHHYFAPGLLYEPSASLDGLMQGPSRYFGQKAGMTDRAMECTVVSRFEMTPNGPMTVIGPVTIAEVPGG